MSAVLDQFIMESFEEEAFNSIAVDLNGELLDHYLLEADKIDLESSIRYKLFEEGLD